MPRARTDSDRSGRRRGRLETRLALLGAEARVRVVDELAAGTAKPVEQNAGRSVESPATDQGARRGSTGRVPRQNQEPGASRPTVAAGLHVLASQRRRHRATEHRPRASGEFRRARIRERTRGRKLQADLLGLARRWNASKFSSSSPAGKRAMSAAEFLRGNRVSVGDRLGPA